MFIILGTCLVLVSVLCMMIAKSKLERADAHKRKVEVVPWWLWTIAITCCIVGSVLAVLGMYKMAQVQESKSSSILSMFNSRSRRSK